MKSAQQVFVKELKGLVEVILSCASAAIRRDSHVRQKGDPTSTAAGSEPYVPSLEEIRTNAVAACEEIRRQIGLQATDAAAVDTKTSALFTLGAGVLALAIAHLHLDTGNEAASATVAGVIGAGLLVSAAQALRARDGFSYGADPSHLVATIEGYAPYGVMVRMAQSLALAREKNVRFLSVKQGWYDRALASLVVLALALAAMVQTGAIR